jgi:SAM-dependent methyltransferase
VTGILRWVPPKIDLSRPHPARMHDYWLGGGHNFAVDRELAEKIMRLMPGVEDIARLNQAFLRRAAMFLVEAGIRQFLDIGSGIPTVGNLHEVVRRTAPECRIVYVDGDPVAVAHTELILENLEGTAVFRGDLRDVPGILGAEPVRRLLDLSQPVGLVAPMLHFIPDAWDPGCIMAAYRDALAPGSHLVLVHAAGDVRIPGSDEAVEAYQSTRYRINPRSHAEVLAICDGYELVEPGLVGFGEWRPEGPGVSSPIPDLDRTFYAAVGRKP